MITELDKLQEKIEVVVIDGKVGLFVDMRVEPSIIDKNLWVYYCQHSDYDDLEMVSVEANPIHVNFMGTLITNVEFPQDEYGFCVEDFYYATNAYFELDQLKILTQEKLFESLS